MQPESSQSPATCDRPSAPRAARPRDSYRRRWQRRPMATDPRALVHAVARSRHGVVGTVEAMQLGMSRSQLRTDIDKGIWRRAAPGTLVATAAPNTWRQQIAVATVSTGGVASHRAAARLHRLDGHSAEVVELTLPRAARLDRPGWFLHRSSTLDACDVTEVDGIPITNLARTLVDLGAVVGDDLVEQALDDGARRGASSRWISATLDRVHRPGPSGSMALRRVLARPDRAGPLPDSTFERLIERAAVDAGLPPPLRQFRVTRTDGRLIAVLDAAWPDRRIASEAQSERWHGGPRGAQRDLDRHNRLTAMGWKLLYATWADARSPVRYTTRLRELYATSTAC